MEDLIRSKLPNIPFVLCAIISDYAKDPKNDLRLLLSSQVLIIPSSVFYPYPIHITMSKNKIGQTSSSIIYITTNIPGIYDYRGYRRNYTCRNFDKFWTALESQIFTSAQVFGRKYLTFESDVKAMTYCLSLKK